MLQLRSQLWFTEKSSGPAEWVLLWIEYSFRTIGTQDLKIPPPAEIQVRWLHCQRRFSDFSQLHSLIEDLVVLDT